MNKSLHKAANKKPSPTNKKSTIPLKTKKATITTKRRRAVTSPTISTPALSKNDITLTTPRQSIHSFQTKTSSAASPSSSSSSSILTTTRRHFSEASPDQGKGRYDQMVNLITQDFQPAYLKINDTSGGCGAFYQITVVSDKFQGKMTLARHRAVQTTLKDIIPLIHGLNLFTFTPQQWEEKSKEAQTAAV